MLHGIGLVVGLQGTGDRGELVRQMAANLLDQELIPTDVASVTSRNAAVVAVTAELPPFAQPGQRIDVHVASMGDARSLFGGTLLTTPLRAPSGDTVIALAGGPLALGGYSTTGGGGGGRIKNHTNAGRIPGGATVEVPPLDVFANLESLTFSMRDTNFATAVRIARTIDHHLYGSFASAVDGRTIQVEIPEQYHEDPMALISYIQGMDVDVDIPARVVVNERTGTVVIGDAVRIARVAVAHGSLTVEVDSLIGVSQPGAFSSGQTAVVNQLDQSINEEPSELVVVEEGVSIGELVGALNALGVSPRDLITILQAIKSAGALHADLVVL